MKLILLRCPNCGEPLEPGNDDVVLACNNCHTPVAIAVNGPQKMAVRFVNPGKTGKGNWWFPFWVFKGQVRILKRETQGGSRSGRKDSEKMWGMTRHLYVPAWELDMHTAQDIGSRLITKQPPLRFVEQPTEANLVSATVTPKDAKKLLEFMILAIEARRKDWLEDLQFELELEQPELWAMPEGSY